MCYVLQLGGTRDGTTDWNEAFLLTECIHRAFKDTDGVVAFAAITCGLSILCQSTVEDKVGPVLSVSLKSWEVRLIGKVLVLTRSWLILHPMRCGEDTPVPPPPRRTSCVQILVAFVLFDTDGDGKLAFEEVKTYITSVLRLVRALGQDTTGECWGGQQENWHT